MNKSKYIWFVSRTKNGWNEPQPVDYSGDINIPAGYPSVTNNGTLYVPMSRDDTIGLTDIYASRFINGSYSTPENIGNTINTEYGEGDLCVAPDESFLIVSGYNRPDNTGEKEQDLYVSFRSKEGVWSRLINMGETINTEYGENCPMLSPDESYIIFQSDRGGNHEYGDLYISYKDKNGLWIDPINMGENVNSPSSGEGCPWVTPDGKYLFYSGMRYDYKNYSEEPLEYETKMKILNSPGNGSEDIFWVDATVIDELKPESVK